MKTKHTPGPCKVVESTPNTVVTKNGRISVNWSYNADGGQRIVQRIAEVEANARLIAAAPEMYEALKAARAILQATGEWQDPIIREQVEIIKKAIDKAEGGEG